MSERLKQELIAYTKLAVIVIIVSVLLLTQVIINCYIPSDSMENTLMTNDRIIGNRLAYKFGKTPERYDIVIFYAPDEPDTLYIKRVIGLPGETVTIKNGEVYIDNSTEPLDDSFLSETMEPEEEMEFTVPEDCYFMMGDNRNDSWDSRYWDNPYVSKDDIVAKAVFKYWKGFKIL